jgi:hypothetical protein
MISGRILSLIAKHEGQSARSKLLEYCERAEAGSLDIEHQTNLMGLRAPNPRRSPSAGVRGELRTNATRWQTNKNQNTKEPQSLSYELSSTGSGQFIVQCKRPQAPSTNKPVVGSSSRQLGSIPGTLGPTSGNSKRKVHKDTVQDPKEGESLEAMSHSKSHVAAPTNCRWTRVVRLRRLPRGGMPTSFGLLRLLKLPGELPNALGSPELDPQIQSESAFSVLIRCLFVAPV